jgi:uncharacterized protein YbaP (TraB family)
MRKLVVGCAVALAIGAASPAAQAPTKNFLWLVSGEGGPPSYLLGSIHVLTPEFYPLNARIEAAFSASKVLIEEADIDDIMNPQTVMSLVGKAMLPDRTLDQVIAADLYAQVMERADKAGLPRMVVQRMKPWLVALSLTQPALEAAGFKAEHGVDKYFFDRAKTAGMTFRALETVAFQFEMLDQLSPAQQEALLRSTIEDLDNQIANVKIIANGWLKGDTAVVEKLLLTSMTDTPDLYQRMLVQRNASWVAAIDQCAKQQESCFVVVGAAHLVGPDSLVAMLQKKGYKVEQQ